MSLSFVVLIVSMIATRGECARWFLFIGGGENNTDSFMDFFNSVVNTYNNPYDASVIYPPVCSIIHKLLFLMIRPVDFDEVIVDWHKSSQPAALKLYQSFMFIYVIYILILIGLFVFAVNALLKDRSNSEKSLMAFVCILSSPFLFLLDRGNIVGFSIVFAMLFFAYYDHERRWIREFALICLALSVAIKIYPAVFAVILINEKKIKEFFRATLYSAIAFFVPFVFYGGIEGIFKFVKNMTWTSTHHLLGIDLQLSFQKLPIYIGYTFGSDSIVWSVLGFAVMAAAAVIGSYCMFISKTRWKTCAICTCLLIGIPSMSGRYALMFFIIPIVMLLMDEKEGNRLNYVGITIMSLILMVKPLQFWFMKENSRYYGYKVDSFLYMGLFVILCVDAIRQRRKRVRCKNEADGCAEGE